MSICPRTVESSPTPNPSDVSIINEIESTIISNTLSKDGIKLSSLIAFIDQCGGRSCFESLTTTDVNNLYIRPKTNHLKSSYCAYLKTQDSYRECVGEAQVFISHAWKDKFLDVVDTLEYHFIDNPDIILWFDSFSCNLHDNYSDRDWVWWNNAFKANIESFKYTVLVIPQWNQPLPLTRAWCLYEIYCTAVSNCKFEIAMFPQERDCFLQTVHSGVVNRAIQSIDIWNSDSSNNIENTKILNAIKSTVGSIDINNIVRDFLTEWTVTTVQSVMKDIDDKLESAMGHKSLGILYMIQRRYESAELMLREALVTYEDKLGKKHEDTLLVRYNMALLMYKMERYDVALQLYEECLSDITESLGRKDVNTMNAMSDLSSLYHKLEKYDEAISLYTECLMLREEVLGEKHFDTLATMNSLADSYHKSQRHQEALALDSYHKSQRHEEALALYQRCLSIREGLLGPNHYQTLQSLENIASVYVNLGRYDEASELHEKCSAIREEEFGREKHMNNFITMDNVAILDKKIGDNNATIFAEDRPHSVTSSNQLQMINFMIPNEHIQSKIKSFLTSPKHQPINNKVQGK